MSPVTSVIVIYGGKYIVPLVSRRFLTFPCHGSSYTPDFNHKIACSLSVIWILYFFSKLWINVGYAAGRANL